MGALACQGIQIDGQGRNQGFSLARAHFGDHAFVQHYAAYQLNVEMALAQGPLGRLAHGGKGFRQDIVQALSGSHALAEFAGFAAQCAV